MGQSEELADLSSTKSSLHPSELLHSSTTSGCKKFPMVVSEGQSWGWEERGHWLHLLPLPADLGSSGSGFISQVGFILNLWFWENHL